MEVLQRQAVDQKNYSCQTYALGLGADLVMSSLKVDREKPGLEMLKELNAICGNDRIDSIRF